VTPSGTSGDCADQSPAVQFCWHEPLPGPHWLYVEVYPSGHQLKVAPAEVGVPLQ
jgi:hypothetical protein